MRKTTIALLIILISILILILYPALNFKTESRAYIDSNNVLHYEGKLSSAANEKLFKLYKESETKPTMLSITSVGGNVTLGMEFGKWVYDHNIDVTVSDYCLSSCANYIFTAAKRKYLNENSALGWHGGANSDRGKWKEEFSEVQKKEILEIMSQQKAAEENFFSNIAINQRVTTYAQTYHPELINKYNFNNYSIEDMKKFGIDNVMLLDDKWNWEAANKRLQIVRVSVDTKNL